MARGSRIYLFIHFFADDGIEMEDKSGILQNFFRNSHVQCRIAENDEILVPRSPLLTLCFVYLLLHQLAIMSNDTYTTGFSQRTPTRRVCFSSCRQIFYHLRLMVLRY